MKVFSGHGGPRHEFNDTGGRMTVGEPGERVRQPFVRVDDIELAALDERGHHRPVVAAFIRASEQRVFAIEGQRPDAALDDVAVEIDAPVVDEA